MSDAEPRVVVAISDLHAGSRLAVCPPQLELHEGATYIANRIQRHLYECWTDFTERVIPDMLDGDPFALVLNGDMTEGNHHHARDLVDPDESIHYALAARLLRDVAARASRIYMVRGTESHTRSMEFGLGAQLGAERDPVFGGYAADHWRFDVAGCRYSALHHIATTKRPWTEASGLGLAMNAERLNTFRAGYQPAQVMLRAHRHVYGAFMDPSGWLVVTPAWQALTRYGKKVVPGAQPVFGAVVLDHRRCDDGDLPHVRPILYRPIGES